MRPTIILLFMYIFFFSEYDHFSNQVGIPYVEVFTQPTKNYDEVFTLKQTYVASEPIDGWHRLIFWSFNICMGRR